METKRKWLFWTIFFFVLLVAWGLGTQAFYKIKNVWLSDASLNSLKSDAYSSSNFNTDTSQTVFGFNQVVRFFAYFLLVLVLMIFSYYFFHWLDDFIAKEEYKIIDTNLAATKGKYGEYTGKRL
jgi:hypothetical protein